VNTDLVSRVMASEGFRDHKYVDSRGFLTIGYGFNVDAGISRYCAGALMEAQLQEARNLIRDYDWFQACDPVRQDVLVELAFNMGSQKLLGFTHMLAACTAKDWAEAGRQLQASAWFTQVGSRGPPLVELLTNGS
jgi:lysozyme